MVTSTRADAAFVQRRLERRMNGWRRDLRDNVMAAYVQRTTGKSRVDMLAYALLRMDINRIYGDAYSRWPGDTNAPLGRIIQEHTRFSRALAWVRSRQLAQRILRPHPDLLRAIREAA